jgi:hypothetical protein
MELKILSGAFHPHRHGIMKKLRELQTPSYFDKIEISA